MNIFLLIYLTLTIIHMSFRSENLKWASAISKVLLMPSLLLYYLSLNTDTGIPLLLICLALLLGTAGDTFLLAGRRGKLFYAGMLSFFVGHLAYIAYFVLHLQSWGNFLFALLVLAFPLYKIILSFLPSKETLILGLYASILILLTAFTISALSYIALAGAIFFSISDYLIALDIIEKRTFSETAVMGTYTLAQLLLIVGVLALQGGF
ncbi:MAG: lysoplasmalogenase family protein [Sphaerochaeta sp.]|nr:lysoplasmalogenase family protein [Sphaerochaeta sp.]